MGVSAHDQRKLAKKVYRPLACSICATPAAEPIESNAPRILQSASLTTTALEKFVAASSRLGT